MMTLKQLAFSSGRWTATSAFFRFGLQLLQTIVLARLLTPADFGLVALSTAVLAVVWVFVDFGVNRALIHFHDATEPVRSTLFWVNIGLSFILFALLLGLAPMIAPIFGHPELVPLLMLGGVALPVAAAGQQFQALAEKDLQFTQLAIGEVLAALAGLLVSIASALLGAGMYALVLGVLTTTASNSAYLWARLSHCRRPSLHFNIAEARPYLSYGADLVGTNMISVALRQADVFIASLVASATALGAYSVPRDLSLRIALVINPIVTRVGFPVMAKVRAERERLQSIYLHTLRMTTSVNFPIYMAMASYPEELIDVVLGDRFSASAPYLQVLALWGLLRSIGNPIGSLLNAVGQTRRALTWAACQLATLPLLYWLAARHGGLPWLAWGLVAGQVAILVPAWRMMVFPASGISLHHYLGAIVVPAILSVIAFPGSTLVTAMFDSPFIRLAAGIGIGAFVYLVFSFFFNGSWLRSMLELAHPRLSRSSLLAD